MDDAIEVIPPPGHTRDKAESRSLRVDVPGNLPVPCPSMATPRNLVLTGFMATGKTTVGRIVAQHLGFDFVDTDELIEQEHGPIAEIFAEQGESGFRQIERSVARQVASGRRRVIATGGGMVVDPESRETLTRASLIVCLTASPDEINRRINEESKARERPMLASDEPEDRIRSLLAEREGTYSQFDQVVTDGREPEEIADDVIKLWDTALDPARGEPRPLHPMRPPS